MQAIRHMDINKNIAAIGINIEVMLLITLFSCGLLHYDSLQPFGLATKLLIFCTNGMSSLYLSKY